MAKAPAPKPERFVVKKKTPSYLLEIEKRDAEAVIIADMQSLLRVYNTITISQNQFTRHRNELKNSWPALYEFLEIASGRQPSGTMVSFDPAWHNMILSQGPVDKWDSDPEFIFEKTIA